MCNPMGARDSAFFSKASADTRLPNAIGFFLPLNMGSMDKCMETGGLGGQLGLRAYPVETVTA
ncbi:MAG: hypothetical protein P8N49_02845 [Opitutales bacterium]|nr:hypothetical protein [Opitutales bacterium]